MFDAFIIIIISLLLIAIMYPVLNIISISFSSAAPVAKGDVGIWPKEFTLDAYKFVLKDPFIYKGYRNSIIYALGSTAIMLLFTSLMAYPLTNKDFVIKKFITIYLTITMFFSGGMIPAYLLMIKLNLVDTVWVMMIPGCVGAYNVFMFRTFFNSIPAEMKEAALIDGANDIVILFRIILPLSKALLAVFALFGIVGSWNSWFNGLIYLKDQNRYPLQLILRNYLYVLDAAALQARAGSSQVNSSVLFQTRTNPTSVKMGAIVVTILPIMLVYPFLQKYFVKGVMIGAIKG